MRTSNQLNSMQRRSWLPRFRIWHLFVGLAIVAVALWLTTQAGKQVAVVEILEFDAWQETIDNDAPSRTFVSHIKYRFLQPTGLSHQKTLVFFRAPTYIDNDQLVESGSTVKLKYRARNILWLAAENPSTQLLKQLGLSLTQVEGTINEVYFENDHDPPNHP
ncbi:MAG: hypothetical protein ACI87E_002147 [Mariniblastus sp.]|jgi:hypothetical protein